MEDDVDISTLTIEQHVALIRDDVTLGVVKPEIGNDVEFKINSNFMRELRRKLFADTDDEDAHKHVHRVLEIVDLFYFPGITHDVEKINDGPDNVDAVQESFKEAYPTKECPLKKEDKVVEQSEKFKARTTMSKETIKELAPRDLPPTLFLGHLKEQIGSPYRTHETVSMIENPREVYKTKAHEGDMDIGLVYDKEKIVREEEQDYDIPLHDGVMQPLTPQSVHITPPDDDYVALATNSILDKQLNEIRKEFFDITRVAKKENRNQLTM
nr:hypothetical protein [Tanacetum cinerariifolium]